MNARRGRRGADDKRRRGTRRSASGQAPPVVYLTEYDIIDGAMEDPDHALPPELEPQHFELLTLLREDPAAAVRRLEPLLAAHPDVAKLYNYLGSAYNLTGDTDKARALAEENYRRHPDYLFAKLDHAQFCLADGQVERVREILEGKFDLKQLYPHRDAFHLSEFIAFAALVSLYFIAAGDTRAATMYGDVLSKVAPDHPATQEVNHRLLLAVINKASKRLDEAAARRAARPRKKRATRSDPAPHGAAAPAATGSGDATSPPTARGRLKTRPADVEKNKSDSDGASASPSAQKA